MTDPTPLRRIAAGHSTAADARRTVRIASSYRPDEQAEQMLAWRSTDRARFQQLPAQKLISLGYYEKAQRAAADVEAAGTDDAA